jgi:hypothetical protein
MYVRGYLQGSENGRVVTIGLSVDHIRLWKDETVMVSNITNSNKTNNRRQIKIQQSELHQKSNINFCVPLW